MYQSYEVGEKLGLGVLFEAADNFSTKLAGLMDSGLQAVIAEAAT